MMFPRRLLRLRVIVVPAFFVIFTTAAMFGSFAYADDKPEIFPQLGHSKTVSSVAFSADGRYALSGSRDTTLKLWEVATGREVRT